MRAVPLILAAAVLSVALATAAVAQNAPTVGATVKDAKGQVLGVIEKVIVADGRPRQVQIRDGRALRTLPVDGLTSTGGVFVTVLTKAEFQALPVAE